MWGFFFLQKQAPLLLATSGSWRKSWPIRTPLVFFSGAQRSGLWGLLNGCWPGGNAWYHLKKTCVRESRLCAILWASSSRYVQCAINSHVHSNLVKSLKLQGNEVNTRECFLVYCSALLDLILPLLSPIPKYSDPQTRALRVLSFGVRVWLDPGGGKETFIFARRMQSCLGEERQFLEGREKKKVGTLVEGEEETYLGKVEKDNVVPYCVTAPYWKWSEEEASL